MDNNYTEEKLFERIKEEGIDKIVFHVPMRPLNMFPGFPMAWTTSSDPESIVPCKISTKRYDPFEKYKITMQSMIAGFGADHFYLGDFVQLLNRGIISIRGELVTKE